MHFPSHTLAIFGSALVLALTPSCGSDNNNGGYGGVGGSRNPADAAVEAMAGMSGAGGSPGTGGSSDAAAPSATVTIPIPPGAVGKGPNAYGPNPQTIASGTTVTWINQDSVPHTVTSDTGVFDSGTMAPGASFTFTFQQVGTYPYHCTIHGAQSMSGVILVL